MSTESRRDFLKTAGIAVGGVALLGLAGCATDKKKDAAPDQMKMNAGAPGADRMDWRKMDEMHGAGVKAFPAKTAGQGLQELKPKIEGDVKVFELTVEEIEWETEPGKKFPAMAYNGQVPGPVIRATEGDKVRINVKNNMKESTSVHWHGLRLPNKQDGVPFLTQDPITPGATFSYEFVAKPVGTHMYHSHHDSTKQVGSGLLGPFIVEAKDKKTEPAYDKEYIIVLNDGPHGFTLNGKSFPATQPLTAKVGQKLRIRFMNEGSMFHPMHLHGFDMLVFARDGYALPAPFRCDTLGVGPGERWDVIVDVDTPGAWAFHCHILPHAESETGMFGMVTALIVE